MALSGVRACTPFEEGVWALLARLYLEHVPVKTAAPTVVLTRGGYVFLHTYRISLVQNSKCCKKRTTTSCVTLRIRATMADQKRNSTMEFIPVTQLISSKGKFQYVDLRTYGKGTPNKMFS